MNSNKLTLGLNIFRYVLGAIGILACILIIGGPNASGDVETSVVESFRDGARMSFAISYTGFIIIACVALVLIFFILQLISNPKENNHVNYRNNCRVCFVFDFIHDGIL